MRRHLRVRHLRARHLRARHLRVVVALALAGLGLLGPMAPLRAQGQSIGIRLVDAPTNRVDDPRAQVYIVDHLAPGTTIQRRIEVSNDTDAVQTVQLYAASATVNDGQFEFGEGRAANELTRWVTIDPPVVELAPGAKGMVPVTVAVPADASAGEIYGVVWAEVSAPAPAGGGITAVNRVGVRIYLSIGPGGEPPSDFAIASIEAQRDAEGNPVVAATVRNTGGRALDLSGEVRLGDGPGGLSAGPFKADLGTTLGVGETEPVRVTLDRAVPSGPWDARMVLRSGATEREASAKITFPAGPNAGSDPVVVDTGSDGGAPWALLGTGVAGAGGLLVLLLVARRRRRRPDESE